MHSTTEGFYLLILPYCWEYLHAVGSANRCDRGVAAWRSWLDLDSFGWEFRCLLTSLSVCEVENHSGNEQETAGFSSLTGEMWIHGSDWRVYCSAQGVSIINWHTSVPLWLPLHVKATCVVPGSTSWQDWQADPSAPGSCMVTLPASPDSHSHKRHHLSFHLPYKRLPSATVL